MLLGNGQQGLEWGSAQQPLEDMAAKHAILLTWNGKDPPPPPNKELNLPAGTPFHHQVFTLDDACMMVDWASKTSWMRSTSFWSAPGLGCGAGAEQSWPKWGLTGLG